MFWFSPTVSAEVVRLSFFPLLSSPLLFLVLLLPPPLRSTADRRYAQTLILVVLILVKFGGFWVIARNPTSGFSWKLVEILLPGLPEPSKPSRNLPDRRKTKIFRPEKFTETEKTSRVLAVERNLLDENWRNLLRQPSRSFLNPPGPPKTSGEPMVLETKDSRNPEENFTTTVYSCTWVFWTGFSLFYLS